MGYPGRVIEEYDKGAIVAVGEPGAPTYGHQWVPKGGRGEGRYPVGCAAPLALEYTKAPSEWLPARASRNAVEGAWRMWCAHWGVR